MNKFLVVLAAISIWTTTGSLVRSSTKSRAIQNFGCNCLMNMYLQSELELGLEYLNASNYMLHDSMAMRGFGKMFKSFWHTQFENANTVRKYTILRGGVVTTPSFTLKRTNANHFTNVTNILHKFLQHEMDLNQQLLSLHRCAGNNQVDREEEKCRGMNKKLYRGTLFTEIEDPHTASYLDANFLPLKVERLKYLADMFEELVRLHRFHKDKEGSMVDMGLNPIGVHLIDHGLEGIY